MSAKELTAGRRRSKLMRGSFRRKPFSSVLLAAVMITTPASGQSTLKNSIEGIEIGGSKDYRTVTIHTQSKPTFTVFRLSDPMRVVVDISGGDLSKIDGPLEVEDGIIEHIALRQFRSQGFFVGRIVVGFAQTQTYNVTTEGNAVVVRAGDAPRGPLERMSPPPAAPVDRAAAKRFELAKMQAEQAANQARIERDAAERAEQASRKQQEEARRLAQEAKRLHQEAAQAKKNTEYLRQQAEKSVAHKRAEAQRAAQKAEQQLVTLRAQEQRNAEAQAQAEKAALQAKQALRDAQETAARAEAKHRERLAELQSEIAQAQAEKREAEKARAKAELARREAEQARRAAEHARRDAERSRRDMSSQLAAIEARALKAKRLYAEAESARQALAKQRQEIDRRNKSVQAERHALASKSQELSKQEKKLHEKSRALRLEARSVEQRRAQILTQENKLQRKRSSLDKRNKALEEKQRQLTALEQKLKAQSNRTQKQQGQDKANLQTHQNEKKRLEHERRELHKLRQQLEGQQRDVQQDQQKLARVRGQLAKDRDKLESSKRVLDKAQRLLTKQRAEHEKIIQESKSTKAIAVSTLIAEPQERPLLALADIPKSSPPAPLARLTGVYRDKSRGVESILLAFDGDAPTFRAERIENPPRLVVDMDRTKRSTRRTVYGVRHSLVSRVRLGDHEGKVTRAVFDLSKADTHHDVEATPKGLMVRLERSAQKSTLAQREGSPSRTPSKVLTPKSTPTNPTLSDVRFETQGELTRIVLDFEEGGEGEIQPRVDDRSRKAWVLELPGATVPKSLERSLDTTAYKSVVRLISTYQANPDAVKVVANLRGKASQELKREGHALVWEIRGKATPPPTRNATRAVVSATAPQAAGFASTARTIVRATPGQTTSRKKRITVDLKDAEIVNVIRLLSEVSGENIITSDEVKGKVTMRLRNVPWDKALDTILKIKGFDKVKQNNILRIAPATVIQKEREFEANKKSLREKIEQTIIKIITVNYATATEISAQLKPLLTPRGSVQVDARTNTIIVEDVISNIDRLVTLTQRLDRQTPQVLIEARIVEASTNHLEQLGVQWGGFGQATSRAGNPTGLPFPNDVIVAGAADDVNTQNTGVTDPSNFAINLPAPIGSGAGGGIGFIFGSAGGSQILNLRLTAMEQRGQGRIISSPRITTLDNRKATISQGVDIPISVVSAAGVNTRFIKARLTLEVTPHVTNDGSVLMQINTSKNEPDFANLGANGDPTVVTKEAQTEVLVGDGQTTVIGGIYTRNSSKNQVGIPFFSDLPIIGWLFRNKREEDTRSELLIFVTPRIVNRDASRVQGVEMQGSVQEEEGGTP